MLKWKKQSVTSCNNGITVCRGILNTVFFIRFTFLVWSTFCEKIKGLLRWAYSQTKDTTGKKKKICKNEFFTSFKTKAINYKQNSAKIKVGGTEWSMLYYVLWLTDKHSLWVSVNLLHYWSNFTSLCFIKTSLDIWIQTYATLEMFPNLHFMKFELYPP